MNNLSFEDKHQFQVDIGEYPQKPRFEEYLFTEYRHLSQQSDLPLYQFHWIASGNQSIDAQFNVFIDQKKAFSPARATFGGVSFNSELGFASLYEFWRRVELFLENLGIEELTIKMYPQSYQPENSQLLDYVLKLFGYEVLYSDLNFHIPVLNYSYEQNLHQSALRRLKKCLNAGFKVELWQKPQLDFVYEFVKKARERKGFPITMKEQDFQSMFELFPNEYHVLVVKDKENIIALSVIIRINQKIIYSFYPADSADYQQYSPTILLNKGIWEYACEEGAEMLDLGIATESGIPNTGLIRFKENLGAIPSLKLTYSKIGISTSKPLR
jgi:Acetyltransferase (GNAT) domain